MPAGETVRCGDSAFDGPRNPRGKISLASGITFFSRFTTAQKMTPRPLSYYVSVSAGYHYRTKIKSSDKGEWRVAQGREVKADLTWDTQKMPRINPGPAERLARLKPGDVTVLARGERPYALTVPDWPWPALASSSFYVLRPRREYLLPEYLAWWLNTPAIAEALARDMRGAKIRWLPRTALLAREIAPPPLTRQQDIATAAGLIREESRLHEELSAERAGALAGLPSSPESGDMTSRAAHIRLAEAQLDVVRTRLERHFAKLGL